MKKLAQKKEEANREEANRELTERKLKGLEMFVCIDFVIVKCQSLSLGFMLTHS